MPASCHAVSRLNIDRSTYCCLCLSKNGTRPPQPDCPPANNGCNNSDSFKVSHPSLFGTPYLMVSTKLIAKAEALHGDRIHRHSESG
eukprot:scaffold218211_cov20-Prasinocladus_malaysianus.AAC.1